MKIKDILPDHPIDIMVRSNPPPGFDEPDGILNGYCHWDGAKLHPLDGDYYTIEAEIFRHEMTDGYLVVWEIVDWL